MRRLLAITGAGLLTACLVGWVALAGAQQIPGTPPPVPPVPTAPDDLALPGRPDERQLPAGPETSQPTPVPIPNTPPGQPEKLEGVPARPATLPGAMPAPVPGPVGGNMLPTRPVAGEEMPAGAEGLVGRQEPAVSLEWVGPPVAKVGQAGDYSLVVRNLSNIPVQKVTAMVRLPGGLTMQASEPRGVVDGSTLVWDLGTMIPKQERVLQMKLLAETKGDVIPQAWVTFTGSSVMRIRIREPKLALKCSAPEKLLVGDPAAITLTVSNPGDGAADHVKIHAVLSEGLEHARGNKIDFDIGTLAAGESRNVTLLCATRSGGMQKCEAIAEAEGGMTAKDSVAFNIITPRLELVLSGPRLRYLDRKAIYSLKVTNPGDAPARNVTVADTVPAGFKVLAASDGGRHDFQTRTVSWFLGEVGPGQTREVKLEVQAANIGEHKHKATAVGALGLRAEAELPVLIEGLSAILVEMVDTEDPIEVNGDTAYEIRVTNTGSKTESNIKLMATIPDKMQFKNAQGPVRYRAEGRTVIFEPLEKLAPRADVVFRINVRALEPGTVRFSIQVTSDNLTEPVIQMEATRIYADSPEGQSSSSSSSSSPAAMPAVPAAPGAPPRIPLPPGPGGDD